MPAANSTLSAAQYLKRLAAVLLTVTACLAAFNWLINPYQLFDSPKLSGINAFKTQFFKYQLINKPYQLRKQQPDTVILGSSRAGASLRTSHPAYANSKAFNNALAGSGAAIQWYSFEHAINAAPVKRMVLPLDFFMFNACMHQEREAPYRNYAERLATPTVGWDFLKRWPKRWLIDHASALLGLNTSYESWLTLQSQQKFSQSQSGLMHLYRDGYWLNVPAADAAQRSLFHYIENQNLRSGWYPADCYPTDIVKQRNDGQITPLEYVERIINHAHKNRIELQLFISPFHARLAEAMDAAGLWEQFEALKRALVRINERSASAQVEPQAPFPLWDFSGYNGINTEAVPAAGDSASRMQWHRDATHVTAATGDIVQNMLFGIPGASEFAEFGHRLDANSIEPWLDKDRIRRQAYRASYAEDVAEVRARADQARAWKQENPRTEVPGWLK